VTKYASNSHCPFLAVMLEIDLRLMRNPKITASRTANVLRVTSTGNDIGSVDVADGTFAHGYDPSGSSVGVIGKPTSAIRGMGYLIDRVPRGFSLPR